MSEPSPAVGGELHPLEFIAYRCLKQLGAGSVTVDRLGSIQASVYW